MYFRILPICIGIFRDTQIDNPTFDSRTFSPLFYKIFAISSFEQVKVSLDKHFFKSYV